MFVVTFVTSRPKSAALYALFFVGCITIFKTLRARSTGEYDYLLTLSASLQALAFALLVLESKSSVGEGLSEKSLWAFFIAHLTRISTTFWGEGYVPEDNTADVYLYQLMELAGVLLVTFKVLHLNTVRTIQDVGQGMERWSMLIGQAAASIVLAYLTKSTGHNDYFADLSWMFSVWFEAFALAPQVYLLLTVSHRNIDESAAHFAGLTLISALVFAGFWYRIARDHYSEYEKEGAHLFFWGVLGAAFIRVMLCSVYVYLFTRNTSGSKGRGPEYELCAQDEDL